VKVSRGHLGKYVEITWRDPGAAKVRSREFTSHADIPKGWAALATWQERGILDDVTDGVARIVHSQGRDPGHVDDPADEFYITWVPEALIEAVKVFEPIAALPEPP